jgi:hypothetical protein
MNPTMEGLNRDWSWFKAGTKIKHLARIKPHIPAKQLGRMKGMLRTGPRRPWFTFQIVLCKPGAHPMENRRDVLLQWLKHHNVFLSELHFEPDLPQIRGSLELPNPRNVHYFVTVTCVEWTVYSNALFLLLLLNFNDWQSKLCPGAHWLISTVFVPSSFGYRNYPHI